MNFDLVIRGGTLVDGTGAGRPGDVGIRGGAHRRASARRRATPTGRSTPPGCVVAPGFIDIHTHYDAQVSGTAC